MRLVLVVALCACNQVFGLQPTQQTPFIDAQFFDAPPDAALGCPPIGLAPAFSPLLHQTIDQACTKYLPGASGFAIGVCTDTVGIGYGPIDQPLTKAQGLESVEQAVLASSGDVAYTEALLSSGAYAYVAYQRSGDPWSAGASLPFDPTVRHGMSTVARGPTGDRMLVTDTEIHEWTEDATGWREIMPSYSFMELGIQQIPDLIGLTTDGLRIVFSGNLATDPSPRPHILYADRATLADRFAHVQALPGIPVVASAYMTADCSRVYLTGLDTVFYAGRIE